MRPYRLQLQTIGGTLRQVQIERVCCPRLPLQRLPSRERE